MILPTFTSDLSFVLWFIIEVNIETNRREEDKLIPFFLLRCADLE